MSIPGIAPQQIRQHLIAGEEIALIDLRTEAEFALGHPLFASQIPPTRIEVEFPIKIPRRDCLVVLYDRGEGLVQQVEAVLERMDYASVRSMEGGLRAWSDAGYELFEDVNSYSKAFGELVEHRRHTPSLSAEELKEIIESDEPAVILDARRFEEYATMAIPSGISVPGAELVLRARAIAPDPTTRIIVNCAGRTRSIIGAQSLLNAGLPNRIEALRNGTIGWTLVGFDLAHEASERYPDVSEESQSQSARDARDVAYRAGVREINHDDLEFMARNPGRTLYRFDVRSHDEYVAGHLPGFTHAPGGQLVQEIDMFAPVRGARIVLADDKGVRADMTASWLAQMGWDVFVYPFALCDASEQGSGQILRARETEGRYKRPYEGTDNPVAAMEAYLEWEYGLVEQLQRDGTHGFHVI